MHQFNNFLDTSGVLDALTRMRQTSYEEILARQLAEPAVSETMCGEGFCEYAQKIAGLAAHVHAANVSRFEAFLGHVEAAQEQITQLTNLDGENAASFGNVGTFADTYSSADSHAATWGGQF